MYDDRLTDSLASVRRAMDYKANMEAKGSDEEDMDAPIKPYFDRSIDPAEPKELEKQTANLAKGSQSLNDIANSDDDIEVYNNEADIAELKNYMQFMKNSDMEVGKKNRSILVAIMKYLANNMTNDAAANSASEIELSDPAQQAVALKLAKKYLQNKIEVLQPKAKKDLYGKDKTEDTTFEAYAQRMDNIAEGTWSLPENEAEAMKLAAMMANPIALGAGGDDAANALGGLLGDDELFDDLGVAGDKDPEGDARPIIIGWMMDHVDDYGATYKETMQAALDKIRSMGVDSEMVIPRMFGNKRMPANTSATQGERMGSNADEVAEDPNESNESYSPGDEMEDGYVSNCCGAPIMDVYQGYGRCSDCKEMAVAVLEEGKMSAEDELEMLKANVKNPAQSDEAKEKIKARIKELEAMIKKEDLEEGRMSDLAQEIDEVIADMEGDMELYPFTNEFRNEVMKSYNIKAALEKVLPDYVSGSKIAKLVGEAVEEVQEVDEAADMIAKMKAMAGVGSGVRSNHGIHEGEAGYQLTPRSIVAREMRKLQDIERGS